jgi:hypothetical protein
MVLPDKEKTRDDDEVLVEEETEWKSLSRSEYGKYANELFSYSGKLFKELFKLFNFYGTVQVDEVGAPWSRKTWLSLVPSVWIRERNGCIAETMS